MTKRRMVRRGSRFDLPMMISLAAFSAAVALQVPMWTYAVGVWKVRADMRPVIFLATGTATVAVILFWMALNRERPQPGVVVLKPEPSCSCGGPWPCAGRTRPAEPGVVVLGTAGRHRAPRRGLKELVVAGR